MMGRIPYAVGLAALAGGATWLAANALGASGAPVPAAGPDAAAAQSAAAPFTANQEYLFRIIRNRRTVRSFRPTPVPREHLLKILDMARYAPTSGNQQPWRFLVVQDRAKLDRLAVEAANWYLTDLARRRQPTAAELEGLRARVTAALAGALSAPVYVAVLTDAQSPYPSDNRHDGPLAAGTLMIAARALGYGTGYYTTYFPEERMREFFGIPERYNLVCFTPIGIPTQWPAAPPKRPLEEFLVYERF